MFVNDTLEGQAGVPQVISNMVMALENVEDEFSKTTGQWPGIPEHLEDELNQIRTAIRRVAGWTGADINLNTFDASVAVWTDLPDDVLLGGGPLSLKGHVDRVGSFNTVVG